MLLDADKPNASPLPISWRWPSQWPPWAKVVPIVLVWVTSLLGSHIHPNWDYVAFALAMTWGLWLCWDLAASPETRQMTQRQRAWRVARALIGIGLMILLALYFWR